MEDQLPDFYLINLRGSETRNEDRYPDNLCELVSRFALIMLFIYCCTIYKMLQLEAIMVNGNTKNVKRRITLSISPELHEVLTLLGELSGQPVSKFPAHILEESLPVFSKLNESFLIAKKDKQSAIDLMGETLEKAMIDGASELIK